MTTPQHDVPETIYEGARAISSLSRWPASTFGSPPFAGMISAGDLQGSHRQELVLAYLMGLTRLLEEKEVFTQEEFGAAVEGWIADRTEWAESIANSVVDGWNIENPTQVQPPLSAGDLGLRHAEPPAPFPVWPWSYQPDPEESPAGE